MQETIEKFVSDMIDDGFREAGHGVYVKATRGATRVIDIRQLPFKTRLAYPSGRGGAEELLDPAVTSYRAWIRAATAGDAAGHLTIWIIRIAISVAIAIGVLYLLAFLDRS